MEKIVEWKPDIYKLVDYFLQTVPVKLAHSLSVIYSCSPTGKVYKVDKYENKQTSLFTCLDKWSLFFLNMSYLAALLAAVAGVRRREVSPSSTLIFYFSLKIKDPKGLKRSDPRLLAAFSLTFQS